METKKNFVINAAFYGIILVLLAAFWKYILPILSPFIVGFCVAFVIRFLMRKLHLTGPKYERPLAAVLCVAVYVLVVGLLILLSAALVSQISGFAAAMPGLFDTHLYPFFVQLAQHLKAMLAPFDQSVVDWIIELGKTVASSLGQAATNLSASAVKWVAGFATRIPGIIIQIVLTVVATFYIAADYNTVLRFLRKLIPQSHRRITLEALRYAENAVLVYIKSYSLIFLMTFLELTVGLLILQIPYAVVIALAIAVFDLMPVLGTGGILLPWAVILLFMRNYPLAIGIFLLYVVITVVRNAVEPRIVGNQIGLHPLATLVAMILGLRLIGLVGMLAFPIALVAATNLRKSAQNAAGSAGEND